MSSARTLIALLLFNAVTAMAGGLYLVSQPTVVPVAWLEQTPFQNYYVPGVILLAVVGGSSLVAALSIAKRAPGSTVAACTAAVAMLVWIVGEVASIHQLHWLQLVYLATSGAIGLLILTRSSPTEQSSRTSI